jgi:hypothetical protein
MLDPRSTMGARTDPDHDAGMGDLVSRLVAEGRALALAEVEPYKAKATERLGAYKRAGLFFAVAGVLAFCALIALLVGLELTLSPLVGPGGATAIVVIATFAIVGILGLVGKRALAPPQVRREPGSALQLARAEREKEGARRRLFRTLGVIQDRVSPRQIARRAARDAAEKGQTAVDAARRNPGAAAGFTAAAGLFLARHHIAALFRRKRRKNSNSTQTDQASSQGS